MDCSFLKFGQAHLFLKNKPGVKNLSVSCISRRLLEVKVMDMKK